MTGGPPAADRLDDWGRCGGRGRCAAGAPAPAPPSGDGARRGAPANGSTSPAKGARGPWLTGLAAVLAAAVFAIDLTLPMGTAAGVPYMALVCLGWWHPRGGAIRVAATVASGLILAGFLLSSGDSPTVAGLVERILVVIAVWIAAVPLDMARRARRTLAAANDERESLVRLRTRALEQEIAERKQAEAIVTHMASHDDLTGLPLRPLFLDRLGQAVAMARRNRRMVAVMFADLDGFKDVNDSLGHGAGDRLLQEAARRLKACLRETDTVARHGGDEFTVVLIDVAGPAAAGTVAEKILGVLADPFDLGQGRATIGCTVGIAMYPADGERPEALLERADAAMYAAKVAGKSTFCFSSRMDVRAAP